MDPTSTALAWLEPLRTAGPDLHSSHWHHLEQLEADLTELWPPAGGPACSAQLLTLRGAGTGAPGRARPFPRRAARGPGGGGAGRVRVRVP
jgi:hypothetical protein